MIDSPASLAPVEAAPTLLSTAKPIFIGWEKLRPVYLAVNVLWCLLLMLGSTSPTGTFRFYLTCIFGGLFANVCYFAGAICETYLTWLGFRRTGWVRPVLFVGGTLLTIFLATVLVMPQLVPLDERF